MVSDEVFGLFGEHQFGEGGSVFLSEVSKEAGAAAGS